jgi:hypothetical protein
MKVKNVAVVGLESSGTHMVQQKLAEHRELRIWGDSVPTGRGGAMHMPRVPEETDVLIIATRDQNCRQKSADKLYDRTEWPIEKSKAYLCQIAGEFNGTVVWVSYEAIIAFGQSYWNWVHKQCGVGYSAINNDAVFDGNEKYIA